MKVYVATSRAWTYDVEYTVVEHVFATREAAEAYELGDNVEEYEVLDSPPEVRDWYAITRKIGHDRIPQHRVERRDFDGDPDHVQVDVNIDGHDRAYQVVAEGWDLDKVVAAADAKCASFLADQDEWAAGVVAGLDRIPVRVWYEADGRTILQTMVHRTEDHFSVPHDLVCKQAGIDPAESLHGRWFTVQRLTFTEADGFAVCEDLDLDVLAGHSPRMVG